MSCGERSCSREKAPKNAYGGCAVSTMETCNVNCQYYTWDKVTPKDSGQDQPKRYKTFKKKEIKPEDQIYYTSLTKNQRRNLNRRLK